MNLYRFLVPDSKEAIRLPGPCQKNSGAILKRFPLAKDGTVLRPSVDNEADWGISNMLNLKVPNDILKIGHLRRNKKPVHFLNWKIK